MAQMEQAKGILKEKNFHVYIRGAEHRGQRWVLSIPDDRVLINSEIFNNTHHDSDRLSFIPQQTRRT